MRCIVQPTTPMNKTALLRNRCLLAMFIAAAATPHALAQISLCTGTPFTGGYVNFNPTSPDASQAVAISVGRIANKPVDIAAIVSGNAIDVTLNTLPIGLGIPPPTECDTVNVGPLAPGTYMVNFFILNVGMVGATPFLAVTTSLTVGAAPIPATSPLVVAGLAATLIITAFFWIRRRQLRSTFVTLK